MSEQNNNPFDNIEFNDSQVDNTTPQENSTTENIDVSNNQSTSSSINQTNESELFKPVDNSIFQPEQTNLETTSTPTSSTETTSNTSVSKTYEHTTVDTNITTKIECNMLISRIGCIINNYNYILLILIPLMYLLPYIYVLGSVVNLIAIFIITVVTVGLIYSAYSFNDMMILSADNIDNVTKVCYSYVLPITIATMIVSSLVSIICLSICRKNISSLRFSSSIVLFLISIVALLLYFYLKLNGGLEL